MVNDDYTVSTSVTIIRKFEPQYVLVVLWTKHFVNCIIKSTVKTKNCCLRCVQSVKVQRDEQQNEEWRQQEKQDEEQQRLKKRRIRKALPTG